MKIENTYNYAAVNSTDAVSAVATTKSAAAEAKQAAEEAGAKKNVDTMDFSGAKEAKETAGIYSRSAVSIKNESMKEMVQKLIGQQAANAGGQSSFTTQINEMLKEKFGINPVEHNDADDKDYWNAENTANRILEFAKTLAGDNAEAFNGLKGAFEKAFGECEKIWGGKLPDVCYNTKELVSKGFEDIYNEMKNKSAETTTEAAEKTEETEKAAE